MKNMKKKFSKSWKSSKQPRKQRKYLFNMPLHLRRKLFSARLSEELTKKYGCRNVPVRKGDKVKIVRGQYKGHENKIERIDNKKVRVYVTGAERTKTDSSKSLYPIHPSNLIITELNLDDKRRREMLERKSKVKK